MGDCSIVRSSNSFAEFADTANKERMSLMTFPDFTRRLVFRSAFICFFLLAVLAAINGNSVKMISSRYNPNYEGQRFHKILVIVVAQNLEERTDFEAEMAAHIARPAI